MTSISQKKHIGNKISNLSLLFLLSFLISNKSLYNIFPPKYYTSLNLWLVIPFFTLYMYKEFAKDVIGEARSHLSEHPLTYSDYSLPSFRYNTKYMVIKQAIPPIALEMGSARKTPSTPNPNLGSKSVSGVTITAFRSNEKKIACFE